MSRTNYEQLLILFTKQKGKCYYCGKKCKIGYRIENSKIQHDSATIEHVYPKTDIRRYTKKHWQQSKVMACHECNHNMNQRNYYLSEAIGINDYYLEKYEMPNLLIDIYNGKYENAFII